MEANWRWALLAAIAPISWGATYLVTSAFLPPDAPLWGAVIRALPAGLLLLLITRKLPTGSWWWKSLVLGTLTIGAFFALVYVVAQLLPSGLAATLMACSAIAMMLLAWPLLGERPRLIALLGAVIGIAGVAIMLLGGGGDINPLGVLASLAAMLMASAGFVLTKRWGTKDVNIMALTSWQLVSGGLIMVPIALLVEGAPPALDTQALIGFGYVTFIATGLAYVAWYTALRHLTAGAVGLIGLLNPLTGVVLGTLIAGEAFGLPQLLGTVLVLLGILLGQPIAARLLAHARRRDAPH